jgi:NapH/MauN family ferredoxin-type protein
VGDRPDIGRRAFLTGAFRGRNLALAATGGLVWSHILTESRGAEAHLHPPGAREDADFLAACIKCGQCVEACPFDTLSLATLEQEQAVGGRSYCAWVCPVNLVTDSAGWLKQRFKLEAQFRVARGARFWIMGLALLVSAATGVAAFEWISPIGMIHRELIFGPGLGLSVIAVIVLVDLYLAERGWCGSLCPLGAFYSLVGQFALLRIGFVPERCDRCGDCLVICPEKHVIDFTSLEAKGFIDSGDCLNCARCLEVCSRDAYQFTLRSVGDAAK